MLKYLFTAYYEDGGSIYQTPADRSRQRDDKNAFYDVKYAPLVPMDQLTAFALSGCGHIYMVDLRDGRFLVDGVMVEPPDELGKRELIYFRRNSICPQDPTQIHTVYHLGWKIGEFEKVMAIR